LILGRIISPGSELHTYKWFQNLSSLNEFSNYDLSKTGKESFYIVGDLLFNIKENLEQSLRQNTKSEYKLNDTIYLYDLTNTYFETSKPNSELAKFGRSKEKRNDCPLVTLALVVDKNGFPVYSEIYEGNKSEPATRPEILTKIFANINSHVIQPSISIAMDRGIATAENLTYLKENNYSYFIIERRETVKDYKEEFTFKKDFTKYELKQENNVYLKKIEKENCSQVLVFSEGREQKEKAIDPEDEGWANNIKSTTGGITNPGTRDKVYIFDYAFEKNNVLVTMRHESYHVYHLNKYPESKITNLDEQKRFITTYGEAASERRYYNKVVPRNERAALKYAVSSNPIWRMFIPGYEYRPIESVRW
jgi:hypothetical protein